MSFVISDNHSAFLIKKINRYESQDIKIKSPVGKEEKGKCYGSIIHR